MIKTRLRRIRLHGRIRFVQMELAAILICLMVLPSCLPEQKVGRNFVRSAATLNLMVNPPALVFKYNHKGEMIAGFDSLSEAGQDSALWENSIYIRRLSDSLLLESYVNAFISELAPWDLTFY